jgi:DNA end-binding protein Ku
VPRTIWKGHIAFGLVEIPVGLYPATRTGADISFSLLDKRDNSPIGYKKVNKKTGEEVGKDDIVRAYEVEDDRFVVVTDEDFAKANVRATHTIDIVAFVDRDQIEPRYFDKPYYLGPTRKGSKAYALLREALKRTGKVGIARVVMRSRQYVAAVLPYEDVIVLEVLRYAHELREPDEIELPGEDLDELGVRDRELQMAEQLVEQLADDWKPEEWHDTYRDDLLELIKEKAEKGDAAVVPRHTEEGEGEDAGKVVDIMSLLKRSVERSRQAVEPPAKKAAHPRHAAKAKAKKTTSPAAAAKKPRAKKRAGR